jgi:hypothetical protein
VVSVDARLAGVADFNRNARPIWAGMSGRIETEWVAELKRNQWPNWAGIRIRAADGPDQTPQQQIDESEEHVLDLP